MNINDLLEGLHSSDLSNVLSFINESKYIADVLRLDDKCIIHTGFRFKVHTGTSFDLFFDLENNQLIRQNSFDGNDFPCIIGIVCKLEGQYLRRFSNSRLIELSECHNYTTTSKVYDNIVLSINDHPSFDIFKQELEGIKYLGQYPLQRILDCTLFLNNGIFSKFISQEEYNDRIDREREESELDAYTRREQDRDNFDALTDGNLGGYDDYDGDSSGLGIWAGRD